MWLGTKKVSLKRGVHLWDVENVGFICGWVQKKCALERCLLMGG